MRNLILLIIISQLMSACQGQSKLPPKATLEKKVDQLVKEYREIDLFSGVVLIAEDDQTVYHKAFGMANREKGIENTINSRFDIGSMNKSFTKMLILKMVYEGKLSLDDKLGDYLKGFPKEAAEEITIQQLLEHRSGYADYHTPDYWDRPLKEKSIASAVEHIKKLPLMFRPGTEQEYSNAGYVLLGAIAEKVEGMSYYDLIEERIVAPLKMNNTFLQNKLKVKQRAIGYYKNAKGELLSNEDFQEVPTPAGGFYSTTTDILTFYKEFFYGEKVWNDQVRQLADFYPFYEELKEKGGYTGHAGGFEGANTVLYENLKDRISVIVFANMDEPVAEQLGRGILSILQGKEAEKPSLPANQAVYQALKKKGADYVKEHWDQLTKNFHPSDPKDLILNQIGYDLLFGDETDEALVAFQLNTELFPEVANVWDSYGEGLLAQGKQEESLKAYKKALKIRPDMTTAKEAVEKIERSLNAK